MQQKQYIQKELAPDTSSARIAFHTFGCKLNYSETSSITRVFEQQGYRVVDFKSEAEIYVLNTCSVTEFADKKCQKAIRQSKKRNPQARIIVMGCYAQLQPDQIAEMPGVDMVLGAAEKFRLPDIIREMSLTDYGHPIVRVSPVHEVNVFAQAHSYGDRTRSFLKIQDGCDYKCSFCTIPLARGRSRSDSISSVISRAKNIVREGIKEIVLTGVNIGDFGQGTERIEAKRSGKEALFIDLIRELDRVEGIERIRISSIEPNLLTDEIIEFVANSPHFMPHFHIPLQSGNNKLLQFMRRRYRRELYAQRVEKIKKLIPHCCIGVDVIVGFPGETDEDFLESMRFIQDLDISYLHVFTYSERPNTAALSLPDSVPLNKRRKRNELLRQLSADKQRAFYMQHVGLRQKVLLERSKKDQCFTGFTENYIKVKIPAKGQKPNSIIELQLEHEMLDFGE